MSEAPIELGPCEITITRSDGSREIIEAVNASVKPTNKPNESRDTMGVDRPWRTIAEVFPQFGYKSLKAAKNAVDSGCFPAPSRWRRICWPGAGQSMWRLCGRSSKSTGRPD